MIYIIGNKGNMGRRYAAILKYLGVRSFGHDINDDIDLSLMENAKGFIVATPTNLHVTGLTQILWYEKPILCEKPLTKNLKDIEMIESRYEKYLHLVTLVNQYKFLAKPGDGETYYNYFKTGNDGLIWDCLNILGLANGPVKLCNDSPVWKVKINGHELDQSQVDNSYIEMVKDWLDNPKSNWDYIKMAHEKAVNMNRSITFD